MDIHGDPMAMDCVRNDVLVSEPLERYDSKSVCFDSLCMPVNPNLHSSDLISFNTTVRHRNYALYMSSRVHLP